jgi:hypothetical protein
MEENIELSKISIAFLVGLTGLLTVLYQIYKNEKSKRILSLEEVDFILSRGEGDDQLSKELPSLREKQLIEKAYGFSANREEFNSLANDLKGSKIRLTQLKRINSYLFFTNKKASISLGFWEWVIFGLNSLCSFVFLAFSIIIIIWAKDEPFRFLKIIGLLAAVLFPLYFVMYPTFLAWQVRKALKAPKVTGLLKP